MFKNVQENTWLIWIIGILTFIALGAAVTLAVLGKTVPEALWTFAATGLGAFVSALRGAIGKTETAPETTTEVKT